jgi:hypothetical protein
MSRPDAQTMARLVQQGKALPAPGQDRSGRYNIRNRAELEDAIKAVGRAKGGEKGRQIVRRFIIKRARELGLSSMIPDTWNADGSLKT